MTRGADRSRPRAVARRCVAARCARRSARRRAPAARRRRGRRAARCAPRSTSSRRAPVRDDGAHGRHARRERVGRARRRALAPARRGRRSPRAPRSRRARCSSSSTTPTCARSSPSSRCAAGSRRAPSERQRELLAYDKKALSQQAYDQATPELQAVEAQIASLRVTLAKTEIRAPFRAPRRAAPRERGRLGHARDAAHHAAGHEPHQDRLHAARALRRRRRGRADVHASAVAGRGERFEGTRGRDRAGDRRADAQPAGARHRREPVRRAAARRLRVASSCRSRSATDGILVPAAGDRAVGHGPRRLRAARRPAELREVEIGLRTRESVEMLRGLAVGDTVLTIEPAAPAARARASSAVAAHGGGRRREPLRDQHPPARPRDRRARSCSLLFGARLVRVPRRARVPGGRSADRHRARELRRARTRR